MSFDEIFDLTAGVYFNFYNIYVGRLPRLSYQVILEPGIDQFREFEPRRVHTRKNSLGLFLVHKLTCIVESARA